MLFVPAESFLAAALERRRLPDRVRRGAAGRARDPDHPDRAAAHGRPRLEPRGAGRPGPRDPPARPRAARPARRHDRPPRPARPLAQRRRRPLQPDRRLPRVAGAGVRAPLPATSPSPTRSCPSPRQVESTSRSISPPGLHVGRTARPPAARTARTLPWRCEPESDPLGRGPRAGPPGRRCSGSRSPSPRSSLDLLLAGRLGIFFDICFVLLCVALALLVRPPTSSPSACCRRC